MEVLCGHQIPGWLVHRQAQTINLLRSVLLNAGSSIIFQSPKGKALSDMALSQLMRGKRDRGELTVEAVPHGFRSSFRDWASETTSFANETLELALAHTIKNKAEAAYRRQDQIEKRMKLMQLWQQYVETTVSTSGVPTFSHQGFVS
jgi:integrase